MTATATANTVARTTTNAKAANVLWRAQTLFGAPLNAVERKFLEVLAWRDGLTPVQRQGIRDYFCALQELRKDPDHSMGYGYADWLWDRLRDIHDREAWFYYAIYDSGEEDYILEALYRQAV